MLSSRAGVAVPVPDVLMCSHICRCSEQEELTHTCNNHNALGGCSSKAQEESQKIPEKKVGFPFSEPFSIRKEFEGTLSPPRRVARHGAPLGRCFCLPEHPLRGQCPGKQGSDQQGSDCRGHQRLGWDSGSDLSLCRVPPQGSTEQR